MMISGKHIVFGDSAAGTLKAGLRDMGISGYREMVITLSDMLSIGPVWQLHEEIGLQRRYEWLKNHLSHEPSDEFAETYMDSIRNTLFQIRTIDDNAEITIWSGDNAHDQTGVRFILHLLQGRRTKVNLVNVTDAYCKRFNGFDPLHMGEINPQKITEFIKDDLLFQPLSDNDRESLEQEWALFAGDKAVLRIWQDGQIKCVSADYFDERFIHAARLLHSKQSEMDFMKAARLIGEVLGHLDQYVGDQFLEYRLRYLIDRGIFLMEGSTEAMRMYSVKLKGGDIGIRDEMKERLIK